MTTGRRKFNDFCFINLMTPNGAKARDFFSKLLGWTWGEMPDAPGGTLILVEGKTAGALMDLDEAQMPPGIPPVVGVMIKVKNADETVAKVKELGGDSEPIIDIHTNGRMAMCRDPLGAMFNIWQPIDKDGAEHDSHAHGAPTWYENLTHDSQKVTDFYCKLFGWTAQDQHPVPGMVYTLLSLDNVPVAGAMNLMPHMGNIPAHWGVSFAVNDIHKTWELAKELGAELCIAPQAIPTVGQFALLKSPQGVAFHLIQWAAQA